MADYRTLPVVCFGCRKSFKKKPLEDTTHTFLDSMPCPQCGNPLHFVGRYFKAPPCNNLKQWRKVQTLYENGWRANGYYGRKLSTLRAAKTYLREQPEQERAAQLQRKQEEQQQKWSKMRKWPRVHT